jgi:Domain of unknown function (DUF222)
MTQGRLAAQVDRIVARADGHALRRRRERQAGREVSIWDSGEGLTEIFGRLITTDVQAVDARLDALAATVCAGDPRTRDQRRADAMGALAAGADRLACRCARPDCPAGATPPPLAVHCCSLPCACRPARWPHPSPHPWAHAAPTAPR